MARVSVATVIVLATGVSVYGQNLLSNGNFATPFSGSPVASCTLFGPDIARINGQSLAVPGSIAPNPPINGWLVTGSTAALKQNGSIFVPAVCPSTGANDPDTEGIHGSMDKGGTTGMKVWQTVQLVPPANGTDVYKFSGVYCGGFSGTGSPIVNFKLVQGSDPNGSTILGQDLRIGLTDQFWTSFGAQGAPANGTNYVTVVADYIPPGSSGAHGLHLDSCALENLTVPTCTNQPTLDGFNPAKILVRGENNVQLVITGNNFNLADSPDVDLVGPEGEIISAESVSVDSPTQVTAQFDIPGNVTHGPNWSLRYTPDDGCDEQIAGNAVILALPAASNLSFDADDAGGACNPATTSTGVPLDWRKLTDFWGFNNIGTLNGFTTYTALPFLPTCPIDGPNFVSMVNDADSQNERAFLYQVIQVTPGLNYAFSGLFAGSGNTEVDILLLDGGPDNAENPAGLLGITEVNNGVGNFDWRFTTVTGTAPGGGTGFITFMLRARVLDDNPDQAVHADALSFGACVNQPQLISVVPTSAVNIAGAGDDVQINGTGFVAPVDVSLTKSGNVTIIGTDCAISGGGTVLTCDFDLDGAASGFYDVEVVQGGCTDRLTGNQGLFVIATELINGGFEQPTASLDLGNCDAGGTNTTPVAGLPTGWNSEVPGSQLFRDGNTPVPPHTGSGESAECILSSDEGHYGSMSAAGQTMRSYQTLAVNPSFTYRFSGEFAGHTTVTLRLLDGLPNSVNEIASQTVAVTGSSAWIAGMVEGSAVSNIMTVVWEIANPSSGGHADGLVFESITGCNDPRADADGNGWVDQADFAAIQRCITGPGSHTIPAECLCFNFNFDMAIDDTDVDDFFDCVTGPAILHSASPNPACVDQP